MIVMIKMVINPLFFFRIDLKFFYFILAYRQQLREKSQPSHIVCDLDIHLFDRNFVFSENLVSSMASCTRPTSR
jgi:hypothetical protein